MYRPSEGTRDCAIHDLFLLGRVRPKSHRLYDEQPSRFIGWRRSHAHATPEYRKTCNEADSEEEGDG